MKRFAVIGLGQFGSQLARCLARDGAEVIAIDKNIKVIENISKHVAIAVKLDATDPEALKAQGVDTIDAAIVGIGQNFEASVLATVTLKSIGVKHICARAENNQHKQILLRIGADEAIRPEDESAIRWAFKLLSPQISEKLEFDPGFSLVQYTATKSFDKKTLIELQLRKKHKVNLIGIRRGENSPTEKDKNKPSIINVPMPETVINEGDLLWLVGADQDLMNLPNK